MSYMLKASMNTSTSDAAPVAGGLRKLVARIVPGAAVEGLQRLSGGATQETWRFEAVSSLGSTTLILRRAPRGDRLSQEAVGLEIEARLIAPARDRDVPVPPVKHVLTPPDALASAFPFDLLQLNPPSGRLLT